MIYLRCLATKPAYQKRRNDQFDNLGRNVWAREEEAALSKFEANVVRDITKKLLEKLSYVLSNFRVLTPIIERSGALAESARKLDF